MCKLCDTYDFNQVQILDQLGETIIALRSGSAPFPMSEHFQHCPLCGRRIFYDEFSKGSEHIFVVKHDEDFEDVYYGKIISVFGNDVTFITMLTDQPVSFTVKKVDVFSLSEYLHYKYIAYNANRTEHFKIDVKLGV